jgi:hypothetical protein
MSSLRAAVECCSPQKNAIAQGNYRKCWLLLKYDIGAHVMKPHLNRKVHPALNVNKSKSLQSEFSDTLIGCDCLMKVKLCIFCDADGTAHHF